MSNEYENMRRIVYDGGATFIPVCDKCGRFVKLDKQMRLQDYQQTAIQIVVNAEELI